MAEYKPRNLEVELFRIISIFGIVWFHSGIKFGRDIAGSGLIYFIIVSVYYATKSKHTHSLLDRVKRILIPWIVFSIFYGGFNFIIHGQIYLKEYHIISKILATPAIHLWFLPFIFFVLVAIDNLRDYFRKKWAVPLLGLIFIIVTLLAPIWRSFVYIPPIGQYASAIPAVIIGVFFGISTGDRERLIITFCIIAPILALIFIQLPGAISYLVGILPCYFLFKGRMKTKENSYFTHISSSVMGIYLFHPFIGIVLSHVGVAGFLLPTTTFVVSLCSVLVYNLYFPIGNGRKTLRG